MVLLGSKSPANLSAMKQTDGLQILYPTKLAAVFSWSCQLLTGLRPDFAQRRNFTADFLCSLDSLQPQVALVDRRHQHRYHLPLVLHFQYTIRVCSAFYIFGAASGCYQVLYDNRLQTTSFSCIRFVRETISSYLFVNFVEQIVVALETELDCAQALAGLYKH